MAGTVVTTDNPSGYATIQNISLVEDNGAIKSLTADYQVHPPGGGWSPKDGSQIVQCLSATGLPAANQAGTATGLENLVVTKRTVKPDNGDNDIMRVTVVYEPKGGDTDQTNLIIRTSASLEQIETEVDKFGNAVTVQHTYPSDDYEFPSQTITQGGKVQVTNAVASRTATGLFTTDIPSAELDIFLNKVNGNPWGGAEAGTWLCTDASYVPHDLAVSPSEYIFTFEFQFKEEGWNPKAVFTRPDGSVPSGIVQGVGTTSVDWYFRVDFNETFPLSIGG